MSYFLVVMGWLRPYECSSNSLLLVFVSSLTWENVHIFTWRIKRKDLHIFAIISDYWQVDRGISSITWPISHLNMDKDSFFSQPSTSTSLNLDHPRARNQKSKGLQCLNWNNEKANSLTVSSLKQLPLLLPEGFSIDRVMARYHTSFAKPRKS
jgi:hypothetical protein